MLGDAGLCLSIPFMGFFVLKRVLGRGCYDCKHFFQFPLWDFSRWNSTTDSLETRSIEFFQFPLWDFLCWNFWKKKSFGLGYWFRLSIPFMGFFLLKQYRSIGLGVRLVKAFNSLYGIFLTETYIELTYSCLFAIWNFQFPLWDFSYWNIHRTHLLMPLRNLELSIPFMGFFLLKPSSVAQK